MTRFFSVLFLSVSCVQNGTITHEENEFCESAQDVALVVTQACEAGISQPSLDNQGRAQEVERWMAVEYKDAREAVISAREACVQARPWDKAAEDMVIDCETLETCLSAQGVAFPAPWPEEVFSDDPSECFDPSVVDEEEY